MSDENTRVSQRQEIEDYEVRGSMSCRDGHESQSFLIINLSETGLRITHKKPMKVGVHIEMVLDVPYNFELEGEVVWCREDDQGFESGVHILVNRIVLADLYDSFID